MRGGGASGQVDVRNVQALTQHLENVRHDVRRIEEGDVILENGRRALIRSANGTYWSVTVTDAGVLQTTNVGTTL
ncbi:MAG TPA: hypothetical protein VGR19_02250 [Allosphingosinicella sp.]|nr:hypothetical protein [Allosphingosinicella sp.]